MSGEQSLKKKANFSHHKTTLRLHLTTVKMAKIYKQKLNAHVDVGEGKHLFIAGGSANCATTVDIRVEELQRM